MKVTCKKYQCTVKVFREDIAGADTKDVILCYGKKLFEEFRRKEDQAIMKGYLEYGFFYDGSNNPI